MASGRKLLLIMLAILLIAAWSGCGDDGGDGGRASDDDDDDDTGDDDTGDDDSGDDDSGDDDTGDDDTGDDDDELIWTEVAATGDLPDPLGFVEAVSDTTGKRMLFYGGGSNPWPTYNNELVTFDFTANAYGRIVATGDAVPGLYGSAIGWDQSAQELYLFGGAISAKSAGASLYVLDADQEIWTLAGDGTATIGPRQLASGVYDGSRFIVYGGYDPTTKALMGDTWEIVWNGNPGETIFNQLTTVGPDARSNAATCWDASAELWYLFGGAGIVSGYADLWAFDPVAEAWTKLTPVGTAPVALHSARCFVDSTRQRLIAFSGIGDDALQHAEIWVLDLAAQPPSWQTYTPAGQEIEPRYGGAIAYDPDGDRLIYFGGLAYTSDKAFEFFGDTHELLLAGPERF